jgi:hypothetical protein
MLVAPQKPVKVKEAPINPLLKHQRVRTIAGPAAGPSKHQDDATIVSHHHHHHRKGPSRKSDYSDASVAERIELANRNTMESRRRRFSSVARLTGTDAAALPDAISLSRQDSCMAGDEDSPLTLNVAGDADISVYSGSASEEDSDRDDQIANSAEPEHVTPLHLLTEDELREKVALGVTARKLVRWLRDACPIPQKRNSLFVSVPGATPPINTESLDHLHLLGRVVFPPVQQGLLNRQIIGLQWETEWRVSFTETLKRVEDLFITPKPPPQLLPVLAEGSPAGASLPSGRRGGPSSRSSLCSSPIGPGSPRKQQLLAPMAEHEAGKRTPPPLSLLRSASPPRHVAASSSPFSLRGKQTHSSAVPSSVPTAESLVVVPHRLKDMLDICRKTPVASTSPGRPTGQSPPGSPHLSPESSFLSHSRGTGHQALPRDLVAGAKRVPQDKLHVQQFIVNFSHELSQRPDLTSVLLHHTPLGLYEAVFLFRMGFGKMQYSSLQRLALTSCGIDGACLAALLAWVSSISVSKKKRTAQQKDLSASRIGDEDEEELTGAAGADSSDEDEDDFGVDSVMKLVEEHEEALDNAPELLHTLDLSHNVITAKDLPILCDIILRCPSIYCLALKDNPLIELTDQVGSKAGPNGAEEVVIPGIAALALGGRSAGANPLPGTAAAATFVYANKDFANFMALTPQLESLDLGFCNLQDGEVIKVCHRLFDRRCSIMRLNIDGANITTTVATLLLETIQTKNRSLFEFSAKYTCNCSSYNFRRKINAVLRRNIRHCLNRGAESTLFRHLRRQESFVVPPHPTLEKMLEQAKSTRPFASQHAPATGVGEAANADGACCDIVICVATSPLPHEMNDSDEDVAALLPQVANGNGDDDYDEAREVQVMKEWGGWENRGLKSGYHGYTSNDPSLVARQRALRAAKKVIR